MGVKLIDKGSIEKLDRKLFLASVILAVINFLVTLLMYLDVFKDNFITYFTWPAAIILPSLIMIAPSCRGALS